MTLTEKLDLLLTERNLNKSQLSAQSGLPYTTIVSLYEKGSENVKRSTLLALARSAHRSFEPITTDEAT